MKSSILRLSIKKTFMKIAFILLDDFQTKDDKDFADLGMELISKILTPSTSSLSLWFKLEKFDYVRKGELPNAAEFDTIYLTGSRKDSYLDNPFNNKLIQYLSNVITGGYNVKLLGICFGHQIIARSIGLKTGVNPLGWEMGNTIVKNGEDTFVISEMHRDIVYAENLDVLEKFNISTFGSSDKCNIQGFKGGKLLTFQGHPEFDSDLTMAMIKSKFENGLVDSKFYEDAIERYKKLKEDGLNVNGESTLQRMIKEFLINK